MKKILLVISILFSIRCSSQTQPSDSSQTYISIAPCVTNEIGNIATKFSPTIEIGKQFDNVFTTGLAIGKTNCAKRGYDDIYLEFRPNLNVFQLGRFTNTLTTGIGYVCEPNESLMLELTTGVEFDYSSYWHVNFFFGNYYYSGFYKDNTISPPHKDVTFFGFSIVKFFEPSYTKGLFKIRK